MSPDSSSFVDTATQVKTSTSVTWRTMTYFPSFMRCFFDLDFVPVLYLSWIGIRIGVRVTVTATFALIIGVFCGSFVGRVLIGCAFTQLKKTIGFLVFRHSQKNLLGSFYLLVPGPPKHCRAFVSGVAGAVPAPMVSLQIAYHLHLSTFHHHCRPRHQVLSCLCKRRCRESVLHGNTREQKNVAWVSCLTWSSFWGSTILALNRVTVSI